MNIILIRAINSILRAVVYLIIGRAILSWFIRPGDRLFPLYMGIVKITEPILTPFRELSMRIMGNSSIDFSPMLAIIVIYFLQGIVTKLLLFFGLY